MTAVTAPRSPSSPRVSGSGICVEVGKLGLVEVAQEGVVQSCLWNLPGIEGCMRLLPRLLLRQEPHLPRAVKQGYVDPLPVHVKPLQEVVRVSWGEMRASPD